ncbi:4-hydroxy-tetrahydrodipicolinate reductase, partial [Coprobacillus cateniformis]|nr:4-hydroxy-tetrahydrodipicolinate reductase [Coprobacillus cateniformis]
MNILVCGFGLMGKKVVQAVRDNKKMNLIGVVSPIFDETIKENMYSSFQEVHDHI